MRNLRPKRRSGDPPPVRETLDALTPISPFRAFTPLPRLDPGFEHDRAFAPYQPPDLFLYRDTEQSGLGLARVVQVLSHRPTLGHRRTPDDPPWERHDYIPKYRVQVRTVLNVWSANWRYVLPEHIHRGYFRADNTARPPLTRVADLWRDGA